MSSGILALKLLLFTVILCSIAVKLPFEKSIRAIVDLSKSSLGLISDSSLSDDESAAAMRRHSGRIMVETLRISGFIAILVLAAVSSWFALNFDQSFTADSFDVFLTVEGIVYSLVGIALFVGFRKVIHRG